MLKTGAFSLPVVVASVKSSVFANFHILNYVCKKAFQNGFVNSLVLWSRELNITENHSFLQSFYEERRKGSSWGLTIYTYIVYIYIERERERKVYLPDEQCGAPSLQHSWKRPCRAFTGGSLILLPFLFDRSRLQLAD